MTETGETRAQNPRTTVSLRLSQGPGGLLAVIVGSLAVGVIGVWPLVASTSRAMVLDLAGTIDVATADTARLGGPLDRVPFVEDGRPIETAAGLSLAPAFPLVRHPPGYAALLVAGDQVGLSPVEAARGVAILAHFATTAVLGIAAGCSVLLRRVPGRPLLAAATALVCAGLYGANPDVVLLGTVVGPDSLMAAAAVAVSLLAALADARSRRGPIVVVAVALAMGASLVRWYGLVLLLPALWTLRPPSLSGWTQGYRRLRLPAGVTLLAVPALWTLLRARDSVLGPTPLDLERPPLAYLAKLAATLLRQILPHGVSELGSGAVFGVGTLVVVATVAGWRAAPARDRKRFLPLLLTAGLLVAAAVAARVTTGAVAAPEFSAALRSARPLIVLITVVGVAHLLVNWMGSDGRLAVLGLAVSTMVAILTIGVGIQSARTSVVPLRGMRADPFEDTATTDVIDLLARNEASEVVMSDAPSSLWLVTRRPAITLPALPPRWLRTPSLVCLRLRQTTSLALAKNLILVVFHPDRGSTPTAEELDRAGFVPADSAGGATLYRAVRSGSESSAGSGTTSDVDECGTT